MGTHKPKSEGNIMNLQAAIRKAKLIVQEIEKSKSERNNKLLVVTEYNEPLNGELVVILYTDKD